MPHFYSTPEVITITILEPYFYLIYNRKLQLFYRSLFGNVLILYGLDFIRIVGVN